MRRNFRTYELSVEFYKQCQRLRVPSYLRKQLNRASSSVSLNLAEGSGRNSVKEQHRFFEIAFASLRECQAVLDLVPAAPATLIACADSLAAHLYCLQKKVAERLPET